MLCFNNDIPIQTAFWQEPTFWGIFVGLFVWFIPLLCEELRLRIILFYLFILFWWTKALTFNSRHHRQQKAAQNQQIIHHEASMKSRGSEKKTPTTGTTTIWLRRQKEEALTDWHVHIRAISEFPPAVSSPIIRKASLFSSLCLSLSPRAHSCYSVARYCCYVFGILAMKEAVASLRTVQRAGLNPTASHQWAHSAGHKKIKGGRGR